MAQKSHNISRINDSHDQYQNNITMDNITTETNYPMTASIPNTGNKNNLSINNRIQEVSTKPIDITMEYSQERCSDNRIDEDKTDDNHSSQEIASPSTNLDDSTSLAHPTLPKRLSDIDNCWEGNTMQSKDVNSIRLVFQNINSLQPKNNIKWIQTIQSAIEQEVDMLGLVETSVNWNLRKLKLRHRKNLIAEARQNGITSTAITFSRNETVSEAAYLPGGTVSVTLGKWTGLLQEHLHDHGKMGRWTGQQFRINEETSLFVITAYRVCHAPSNSNSTATTSSHEQQKVILRSRGVSNPDPRQQFIDDLISHLQIWNISRQDHVIIMMDANEILGSKKTGIHKLMEQGNLQEVFQEKHPDRHDDEFPSHINGSRRIDFILARPQTCQFIKAIGYAPFYSLFDSDHRAIFCDLDSSITKQRVVPLVAPPTRLIGSNSSPQESTNYIRYVYDQFDRHRIFEKAVDLFEEANIQHEDDEVFCSRLNTLDDHITLIMLKAERDNCSRKHAVMWSPAILYSCLMIQYWTIKMKAARRNLDVSEQLQRIKSKLPETHAMMLTNNHQSAKAALADEKMNQRKLFKEHYELRSEYLKEKVSDSRKEGNDKEAKEIQQLQKRETMKRDYAELRTVFHPNRSNGISHLEIHDPTNGTVTKITDPQQIEATIIQRNVAHFGQAQGTPFTTGKIKDILGYEGRGEIMDQIIKGEVSDLLLEDDEGAKILFQRLSDGGRLPTINADVSFHEYSSAFKKWAEKTSTSPSGRHLGHYKVLIHTDGIPIGEDDLVTMNDKIMQVYHQVSTAAVKSGNSLTRWQKVTTAMIEKIVGCPRIDKLRVIHLYEADYNLILKILWARKLVWNAHNEKCLHDGQSGSRPGRRAIDVVIQKEMKYLYARLSQTNLATMDNDAKSCYDRIICCLAMLVSRYFGMPLHACLMQAKTLKKMQFKLRTALGDSKSSYQHHELTPVHGSGQGSCASPCLWLLLSSTLMECLSRSGHGMQQRNVQNDEIVHQWIDGFVDDTSIFTNSAHDNQDLHRLVSMLRHDSAFWSKLLSASGGMLELPKCFYYILNWKHDKNGNPIPTSIAEQSKHTSPITLPAGLGKPEIRIVQKEVTAAHKTLGTMKTIIGDESVHKSFLLKKSDNFATKVLHAKLSRRQAMLAYNTIYIPAMLYSLPATNLSESDLNIIQSKATGRFLSASGFEKGFPRAVVHGPKSYGGLGMPHLYTEEMALKIEALISHSRADTSLGRALRLNLNWTQLTAGLSEFVLESTSPVEYISCNWIMHVREFLIKIRGTIHIKDAWKPTITREEDFMLMDKLPELKLGKTDQKIINNWRMYLQVNSYADITNAYGDKIEMGYRQFDQLHNTTQSSTLNWPKQGQPHQSTFRVWKKFIAKITGMDSKGNVRKKLGKWLIGPNEIERKFHYYLVLDDNSLWMSDSQGFSVHRCSWERSIIRRFSKLRSAHRSILPSDAIPIDISIHEFWYQVSLPRHRGPSSFNDLLHDVDTSDEDQESSNQWDVAITPNLKTYDTTNLSMLLASPAKLYLVSDGSLCEPRGGFASVFATDDEFLAHVHGATPLVGELNTSYRTEAYGMLSGLVMVQKLIKTYRCRISSSRVIQVYSDSESLIKTIVKCTRMNMTIKAYYGPDMDIILQILDSIKQLASKNIITVFEHVKGHQDGAPITTPLSRPAILNIEADRLAGFHMGLAIPGYYEFPANQTTFKVHGIPVTSKYKFIIRNSHLTQELREYMQQKYKWSDHTMECVWWKCHKKALDNLTPNDRIRIQKFIFNRWATNHRAAMYEPHATAKCDHCSEPDETADHVLKCKSPARQEIRTQWINELQEYLDTHHTPEAVTSILISGVKNWLNDEETPHLCTMERSASVHLRKAVREQQKMGWDHFIKGRITREWASFINHELLTKKVDTKYYTAETWGADIISINWKFVMELWKVRNVETHGSEPAEQITMAKEKLLAEAIWIQAQQIDLQGEDRKYIMTPHEALNKMHASHLRAWIRNVKILIKASAPHIRNVIRNTDVRQYLKQPRRPGVKSGLHTPTCSVRIRSIP